MKTMICGLAAAAVLALGASTASAQYRAYPRPVPVPVYTPGVVVGGAVAVPGGVVGGAYVAPAPVPPPVGVNVGFFGSLYRPYFAPRPVYYPGGHFHDGHYHGYPHGYHR